MGGMGRHITWRHCCPILWDGHLFPLLLNVPRAIFTEAALSLYRYRRPNLPRPAGGTMIQDGFGLIFAKPYMLLFPAIALALLMLAFTFLGDGLRDALDRK